MYNCLRRNRVRIVFFEVWTEERTLNRSWRSLYSIIHVYKLIIKYLSIKSQKAMDTWVILSSMGTWVTTSLFQVQFLVKEFKYYFFRFLSEKVWSQLYEHVSILFHFLVKNIIYVSNDNIQYNLLKTHKLSNTYCIQFDQFWCTAAQDVRVPTFMDEK